MRILDQKINDSNASIWSLCISFRFSHRKSQSQQKLAKKINIQFSLAQKTSLILQTSAHSIL